MMMQFDHSLCLLFLVFILQEYNLPKGRNPPFFCLLLYPVFPITPDKTQVFGGPVDGMTQWVSGWLPGLVIWAGASEMAPQHVVLCLHLAHSPLTHHKRNNTKLHM